MLAVLFGLGYFYYSYLSSTDLHDKWWIGPLLALSVVFFLSNLQGVYFSIRQFLASRKPETAWKDGELVGFSGHLQATGSPIEAPFSGKRAAIVEYELSRVSTSGDSTTKSKCVNGMLMTPCVVQTRRRSVKLIGFPLMVNLAATINDETNYRNAARYIANTKFEELPGNPIAVIKKLSELLADDDGDLKADFKDKNFYIPGPDDEDLENLEPDNTAPISSGDKPQGSAAAEDKIYNTLISDSYDLQESLFEHGAQVAVFGTYRANKQAVDIGSGLKNLQHSIQKGTLESVIKKGLTKSVIFTLIFGAVTVMAHRYVAQLIGLQFPF